MYRPVAHRHATPGGVPGDVEAALTAYEMALFPRSAKAAAESARNHRLIFDDHAPQSLIDLLTINEE